RSKVTIAGVTVGQVSEIKLDNETFMAVVKMDIDGSVTDLSTDSTAAILTEGLLGGKYIGISIGADERILGDGDQIYDTQSAVVLEELIGQFLMKQF
ncbi:MAG: MlaD family protein, partial [Pseudomonadales bacterium]